MNLWRGEICQAALFFLKDAWCFVDYVSYYLYSESLLSGHLGCFSGFLFPTVQMCASISL